MGLPILLYALAYIWMFYSDFDVILLLGENECPSDATCDTFEAKFKNASNMCETIWNKSYTVVPDTESCMVLWFDPSRGGNPNEKVCR